MENAIKYPKTFHYPFSEGLQNDDRRMEDETCFNGKDVAITIKMDGENTSMYRDGIHARSLYAMSHSSQDFIKGFWGNIRYDIPKGWRVCGESMFARHSIEYNDLESFFYVFSVWNENNVCLSLDETLKFCEERDLKHVDILGVVRIEDNNFDVLEREYKAIVEQGHEGIVVRNIKSYHFSEFQQNIAKAVRKNHVQTSKHWTTTWVPNKLKQS
jgi:hypothetical protein